MCSQTVPQNFGIDLLSLASRYNTVFLMISQDLGYYAPSVKCSGEAEKVYQNCSVDLQIYHNNSTYGE